MSIVQYLPTVHRNLIAFSGPKTCSAMPVGTALYSKMLISVFGNIMPTRCKRFLLQILLLAQHVSGTTMPIIRSSRVLYSGCCLWYFVL